jgi:hypothetical protein
MTSTMITSWFPQGLKAPLPETLATRHPASPIPALSPHLKEAELKKTASCCLQDDPEGFQIPEKGLRAKMAELTEHFPGRS